MILEVHNEDQNNFFNFFLNEFRTINFFTAAAFGSTKARTPDKLYTLHYEQKQKLESQLKAIEKANKGLTEDQFELFKRNGLFD